MKKTFQIILILIVLFSVKVFSAQPELKFKGLYQDPNGDTTNPADDTISGNVFMTLSFLAGDPDGFTDIKTISVKFWHTNTSTNSPYLYNHNFAEYRYLITEGIWACLGPVDWDLDRSYSKGPLAGSTGTTNYNFTLVFKPSSQATESISSKDWRILITVSDTASSTNFIKSYKLRQIISFNNLERGELSAYPNPFRVKDNEEITFVYEPGFNEDCKVSLDILTIAGDFVISLEKDKDYSAGSRLEKSWNGKNKNNKLVASGIYSARLKIIYNESKRSEILLFNFALIR